MTPRDPADRDPLDIEIDRVWHAMKCAPTAEAVEGHGVRLERLIREREKRALGDGRPPKRPVG